MYFWVTALRHSVINGMIIIFIELIAYLIVLYISIYLFPWLHALCDPSSINNNSKHAILIIFMSVFFGTLNFRLVVCVSIYSCAHNASRKMTLRIWAVNILTFTLT